MKTTKLKAAAKEIAQAARIAMQGPDQDNSWEKLAEYFDSRRESAKSIVEPRPARENQ